MGIIKSKFKKMEEFDCSMDDFGDKIEEINNEDPRSPTSTITRTPLHEFRGKSSLISKTSNLANISTPIHNDLLLIHDKRFKHLAQSFIDPRSPSEGIVRTPIVFKSREVSSIVNTPRILEEDLLEDEEDFQKTFEEALSKISFDGHLDEEEEEEDQEKPHLIETHFDCILGDALDSHPIEPLKPMNLVKISTQSALDPRSPSIGIDRTPLAFGHHHQERFISEVEVNIIDFEDQLSGEDEEGENVTKEDNCAIEKKTKEGGEEEMKQGSTDIQKAEVFIEVGHVIYGTPVAINATSNTNNPQQARTPLSCLANRKRVDLNGKVGKSPMSQKKMVNKENVGGGELKVKRAGTNPFETTPRKLIR